jgi:uncharacterized protein involved in exopolysaccharide biosynthesis
MEDDLELRRYIRGLFRRAWLIVLLVVVGGAAAFIYASQRTTTYEATTLLAVSRPLYALDLDGVSQTGPVPLRTYAEIALSDEVVQTLHDRMEAAGAEVLDVTRLRLRLSATASTDTGLLTLSVVDTDSARAALTANTWAQVILEQNLALYGPDSPQMASYEGQLDAMGADLATAVGNRAAFQAQNQVGNLGARLGNLQGQLIGALNRQTRYPLLAADAQSLLTRLNGQDRSAPASTADEAALLLLVAQASDPGLPLPSNPVGTIINPSNTDVDVNQQTAGPLQVQISVTGGASSQTVGALAEAVQNFIDDLNTRTETANSLAESLQPQILEAQAALAEATRQADDINRVVALIEAQYSNLSALVQQAKLAAQDAADLVRVASPASVPSLPSTSGRLITTAIGLVAGLILAIVIIVALEWWRTPLPAPRRETPPAGAA